MPNPSATLAPFAVSDPDFNCSPLTGMTRRHWLQAGRHILDGAFQHIDGFDDPLLFPKHPGISYPREGYEKDPERRIHAIFEALTRTFNLAAPLIAEDPEVRIRGIRLREYYRHHLLRAVADPGCPYYIGDGAAMDQPRQQTCELGNLALWSFLLPDVFWGTLDAGEKDAVAANMSAWAHGWTLPHNWRWFNAMMLAFLLRHGYEADEDLMLAHVDHLIVHHGGQGWYRDVSYDYYTIHVFQLYGSLWNRFYGDTHAPARAAMIDGPFAAFLDHYPMLFDRTGRIPMYGRSILYRLGAAAGIAADALRDPGRETVLPPGLARRLASGSLLQFIGHPDFFHNATPALGFYGPYEPALQGYSCSASPYWMFLNYACVALPESAPFWSAREEEDPWWESGAPRRDRYLAGPGILLTQHASTSASEWRPSKAGNADPNYARLSYNTAFPWAGSGPGEPVSCGLSLRRIGKDEQAGPPEHIDSAGYRDGVLYRQATFRGDHFAARVDIATATIPYGEIQVLRLRKVHETHLMAGHFALPHLRGDPPQVESREIRGRVCMTAAIPGRRVALTLVSGWEGVEAFSPAPPHPEAERGSLLFAHVTDEKRYGPLSLHVACFLHRCDDAPWTDDQLDPVAALEPHHPDGPPALTGARLRLRDGSDILVDFGSIDGAASR